MIVSVDQIPKGIYKLVFLFEDAFHADDKGIAGWLEATVTHKKTGLQFQLVVTGRRAV